MINCIFQTRPSQAPYDCVLVTLLEDQLAYPKVAGPSMKLFCEQLCRLRPGDANMRPIATLPPPLPPSVVSCWCLVVDTKHIITCTCFRLYEGFQFGYNRYDAKDQ